MSKLRPINGNMILRPIDEEEQMAGNIIIPDLGQTRPDMGEIIEISETYNFHSSEYVPNLAKKGDKVIIPNMSGMRVDFNGEELWITSNNSILAIIEE